MAAKILRAGRAVALAACAAVAPLFCCGTAHADTPGWAGVWHGAIGKYPVTVCLQQRDDDWTFGAYYYDKHFQIITLTPPGTKSPAGRLKLVESVELPNAGKPKQPGKAAYAGWDLGAPSGDVLEGSFQGAGDSVLPIKLKRTGDGKESCGGDLFVGALDVTPKLVADRAGRNDAYVAEKLDFQGRADFRISGFELKAADEGAKKINAALRQELLRDGKDALDCRRTALDSNGYDGEFDVTLAPEMATAHWLTARASGETDCGGAHPNALLDYETWDLVSGKQADPWGWFTQAAVKQKTANVGIPQTYTTDEVRPALSALLHKHWPRAQDEDCADAVDHADAWQVRPGPHGMLFSPTLPHVVFACTEDVEIPYGELAPLLNAKGREIVKDIEAGGGGKPN